MCLWRNVKIDQRAKVYSFFKLVFMMKYSCKVEKKPKKTPTQQAKVLLVVMQEALYWGLRLFVDKITLKMSSFSTQSFRLFSEECTEVFPLSWLSKNLHKHDYAV